MLKHCKGYKARTCGTKDALRVLPAYGAYTAGRAGHDSMNAGYMGQHLKIEKTNHIIKKQI